MTLEELNTKYLFFKEITGRSMEVHREYKPGLLESAYEAALEYLLKLKGYTVERQVYLPMFWKDVKLNQHYCMDLVINNSIIVELKAASNVGLPHRKRLWNYLNLTHMPYGMLMNFGAKSFYSEWYHRHEDGTIEKITWRDPIQELIDTKMEEALNSNHS